MKTWNTFITWVFIAIAGAQSCYHGDGEFRSEGIWPMTAYSLELAPFALVNGSSHSFHLRGWRSHKHTLVRLAINAPQPTAFDQLDIAVAVTLKDRHGRTALSLQPDLNSHLKRMRAAGEALWADNEWDCRYEWPDKEVMKQAVPFLVNQAPSPQVELVCSELTELPEHDYDVTVQCVSCPGTPQLQAKLSLASGPK